MKPSRSPRLLALPSILLGIALCAGGAPAQIKGLDGRWDFFNGLGQGRGNVKKIRGTGQPSSGRSVTLHACVSVQEQFQGKDADARRPMWATKAITVGPKGRRLIIDNHLVGRLKVEDNGGEARVEARVSIFEFNPKYGPLAGKKYPPQKKGPPSTRLTAVGTVNIDKKRSDSVWLDPGSYVIEVYILVSAKMTTGLGGDFAISEFMPGNANYGFKATFSDGGNTIPRRHLRNRNGLGSELDEHSDAGGVIGGATGRPFYATAVARDDDGRYVLSGSNALTRKASFAVVDANGKFVRRTTAPAAWTPTTDIARHPLLGFLYLVLADRRLHCFDPATGFFIDSRVVPIPPTLGLGNIVALAYNPLGDYIRTKLGKTGSFWVSDGVRAYEIAEKDGFVLRRLTLPGGLKVTGAAWHPGTGRVWWLGTSNSQHVAVIADATTGALTGLEVIVGLRAVTNGGEITVRNSNGVIEESLTFITTDTQGKRVYRSVNATFVYAASNGGRIALTGRSTLGAPITISLDQCEGSHAMLMFHLDTVAPMAIPPVLDPGSVLALPFNAVVLPPIPVIGGRASLTFRVPNTRIAFGAQAGWQWLISTPGVPFRTSDAGTHTAF